MHFLRTAVALAAVAQLAGVEARNLVKPRVRRSASPEATVSDSSSSSSSSGFCTDPSDVTVTAPYSNIWTDITLTESDAIIGFLFSDSVGFNLTAIENATISDNYIHSIELIRPNKTDALAYISGQTSTTPTRYAKVVINHFGQEDPVFRFYKVGPVPVTNDTTIEPLTEIYRADPTRSVNCGPYDDQMSNAQDVPIAAAMTAIADITQDLLGYGWVYYGSGNDSSTLSYETMAPLGRDGKHRYGWTVFQAPGQQATASPVGLQMGFDFSGTDPSLYSLEAIWYNGQTWTCLEDFRASWEAGTIVRGTQVSPDVTWASTSRTSNDTWGTPELDSRHSPMGVEPEGKRYQVDKDNRYVKWNDFEFFIATDGARGVALFDVKYAGERIIYEIGLQEAIAQYAGNDPGQLSTVYLDSYYGFGRLLFQMIEGYDTPYGATFLNTWANFNGETFLHADSIAIFEVDSGRPIQRHLEGWYTYYGTIESTRDPVLVVRSIATIGNYDYIIDYMFHFDGTIEFEVSASGYLQATYYFEGEYKHGYRIHDALHGSMHDHVVAVKVDLDVAGTENSLQIVDIVQMKADVPDAWFPDYMEVGRHPNTMGISRKFVDSEDDARISWPDNGQGMAIVVNKNATNQWGEMRGYRVAPGVGAVHQTITKTSPFLTNGANWASTDLAATVRKDTEPYLSDEFNQESHLTPLVNSDDFFDGESLDQQDLVLWVTLGMHHVPNTQDIPNTLANIAHTSFILTPFNYFDSEQTRRTAQILQVDLENDVTTVTEYVPVPSCTVNLTALAEVDAYVGLEEYHNVLVKGHHAS
ncbi:hypothetical protein HK405_012622 [Cladochytrium tenue]|nr:hypothetical protein HK405_012622 [Cladochytrium tenue]